MAFNQGSRAFSGYATATFACCDVYGNEGGDWVGEIAGQEGINGNLCLDPLFCNAPGTDFNLADDSPCRGHSPQSPDCDRMGAWPVGCEASGLSALEAPAAATIRIAPNPASGSCRLSFTSSLPEASRMEIFDAAGRMVRSFHDDRLFFGEHAFLWDGRGEGGTQVPNGIYLVRAASGSGVRTGRIVLAR